MVVRLYPSTNPISGLFRKRSIYDTKQGDRISVRGECFNGCIQGILNGARGGKGQVVCNTRGGSGGGSGTFENVIYIPYVTY